ncbi:MAG TPA: aminotransferase class IV [Azospirillum sp.]|nr:aminotransferase class IV [Azospirillum sp.]
MTAAYCNGEFLPLEAIRVSPLDRGFLFGEGIYEVTAVYGGRLFEPDAHVRRLQRGLDELRIDAGRTDEDWRRLMEELVRRSGLDGAATVYLQVTRGAAASRTHIAPAGIRPTVFGMIAPLKLPPESWRTEGVTAVTMQDARWSRCDLKSISLLGSVMAQQNAADNGVVDSLQLRNGLVTEGAATNIFVVRDGAIATPKADHRILAGITRAVILELAAEAGLPHAERDVTAAELATADEVWITSTSKEITPVTTLDGRPVGTGRPGPVWADVFARFKARVGR